MAHCPQSDFPSCKPCFILLKSPPVVGPVLCLRRGIDTVTLCCVNQATLLPTSFRKSMITLLVQPCTVTIGFSSAAARSFLCLVWGLFSGWGESPLRIGCKVSVMVTRSGVVLDNVTRWKWVKEIGNHQYAPCVNWRRSWFMAPGYSVHTCWIYSFFSLCRLAQGQVRVPFSAAHPHHRAVCGTLWWTALRKAGVFQNELSAIYR